MPLPPLADDQIRDPAIYRLLVWTIEFNGLASLDLKRDDLMAPAQAALGEFRKLLAAPPGDADWSLEPGSRREKTVLFPAGGAAPTWSPLNTKVGIEATALLTREHDTLALLVGVTREGVLTSEEVAALEAELAPFARRNDAFLCEFRIIAGRVKDDESAKRLAAALLQSHGPLVVEPIVMGGSSLQAWSAYRTEDLAARHAFFYVDEDSADTIASFYVSELFPDGARYLSKVRHQTEQVAEKHLHSRLARSEQVLVGQSAVYVPADPETSEANLSSFATALHAYRAEIGLLQGVQRTVAINVRNLQDLAKAVTGERAWFSAAARDGARSGYQVEADLGYHLDRLSQAQDQLESLLVSVELDRTRIDRAGEDRAVLITLIFGFLGVALAISGLVDNDAVRGMLEIQTGDTTAATKRAVFAVRAAATLIGGLLALALAITVAGLWTRIGTWIKARSRQSQQR